MKVERYQVKFENGLVEGKRFVGLDNEFQYDPQNLINALEKRGFINKDLSLFFSIPTEPEKNGTISWEINQPADTNQTFEIFSLDDEKLSDDIKENIILRKDKLLNDLKSFHEVSKNSGEQNNKVDEVLEHIFSGEQNIKVVAGHNPNPEINEYFPVAIGWGGDFIDEKKKNLDLVTYTEPQNKNNDIKDSIKVPSPALQSKNLKMLWLYWLLWLIIFLVVLTIAYLLLPSCGVKNFINTCETKESNLYFYENKKTQLLENLTIENNICVSNNFSASPTKDNFPITDQKIDENLKEEVENRLNETGGEIAGLRVSLIWNTKEDLDLKVTCPNQKSVDHVKRNAKTNGCGDLDIDANVASKANKITERPIENIILKEAEGNYKIQVKSITNGSSLRTGTPFEVLVKNGNENTIFEDSIFPGEIKLFSFER